MTEFEVGTCKWFGSAGQAYGYIEYDGGQIYVHYKNIKRANLRDPKFRELRPGDEVKFKVVDGFRNSGTQAGDVEITKHADNND